VIRVLHPVAVHFKGSGFYSTDYGRARKTGRDGDKPDKSDSGDTKDKKDKKEPEKKAPAAEAS
jgi:predicted nucleic acid-binding Zn ribbon protein